MNTAIKQKQLVTYDSGGKAMLIFKPHRKTAVIEFYVPSKKYREYIEVYKQRIEALQAPKKYPRRVPISHMAYHVYNVNKLFQGFISHGIFNPKLDDVIFDINFDTLVVLPSSVYIQHALLKKVLLWQDASLG